MTSPLGTSDFGYPKSKRLRRRCDYLAVQNARFRYRSSLGLLTIRSRRETNAVGALAKAASMRGGQAGGELAVELGVGTYSGPRLGITVTKKVGAAPIRNRWKRVIREAFRLGPAHWPDTRWLDIVLIVRPKTPWASTAEIQDVFREGVNRWQRMYGGSR